MFKKIVAFVTGKVETAIEQNTSPEEAWRSAARILIKEIDRLQHTRVSAVQEIVKLKKKVKEHKDLHSGKESEIKKLLAAGQEVSNSHYVLALQHRNIWQGLQTKIEELEGMNKEIDLSVVELDRKLADVKINLEIIELNKQTESLGLTVPEDVIAAVGHTSVSVDTIVTKIDVLLGGKNAASVTSADVSAYIDSLNAK
ncbi:hypothetical protein CPT_Margaery256 [Citrobacter phage Margaery]|uniref:Uncharacterized protein n=4 Tax=Pseudotevenvirus TaxID=2842979 RepID=A0A0M4S5D9_9CAUD|nr:hypothetical protein GAP161_244 [Cronobacter phage vB_CsaM_GAP161]YP_009195071.1 hypothetical protein CPT_Margaery256 [Citrobacter phage Margaery]AYJ73116.1 hypothetical protein CPT_Maroon_253 [Citrobacter phage Maroon]QPX73612.1 hypothetical protein [Cronobacter phage vB_CsaM_Cronuts]QPX76606.1 hypothetical protein [Cronobacter phage vB_CsaM_SemperBestia]URP85444.1 hypothetical protein ECW1_0048 [Enterobacter phage EC-W1]AFC22354.1 hypothetical protein GAP161_244 [Cronobacter phage vB_Csa